mmetsp:Transcript_3808/g.16504  ORF Transcript_3808/g.16504 Transcript_3808/m.16504 type:complete len:264 (+) Transcript_3808:769-1560(+)
MTRKLSEILDATDELEFKSKCSEFVTDLGRALCGLGAHRTDHAEKNAVIVGKVSGIKDIRPSDPAHAAEYLRGVVAELEPAGSRKIAEEVSLDCTSFLIAGLWIAGEREFHSIKESCEKLLLWLANNAVPQEFFTALCEAYTGAGINLCAVHTASQLFELISITMHRIPRKHYLFFDSMKLIGYETVSSALLGSSDQVKGFIRPQSQWDQWDHRASTETALFSAYTFSCFPCVPVLPSFARNYKSCVQTVGLVMCNSCPGNPS